MVRQVLPAGRLGLLALSAAIFGLFGSQAQGQINLGEAANYGLLFEGLGGKTYTQTNVDFTGNIGIGNNGLAALNGPGTIIGSVDFSAPDTGQRSGNIIPTGGVNYNVAAVTSALNTVNALNTQLGLINGTDVAITNSMTISVGTGVLASGAGFNNVRFFDVTSYTLGNNRTLILDGDAAGDSVVLNFTGNTNFNGQVVLMGGLTADQVIFNWKGGSGGTGGPTLSINNQGDAAHPDNNIQGIFLNPNGTISINSTRMNLGRIFGGDTANLNFTNSTFFSPVAEPSALILAGVGVLLCSAMKVRRRPAPSPT